MPQTKSIAGDIAKSVLRDIGFQSCLAFGGQVCLHNRIEDE
ncbi:unnamed protein product [Arabidopsis halleri]